MAKKTLSELLESLSDEDKQELREALKLPAASGDEDLRETVLTLQKDVSEMLGILKPKPGPKKKGGLLASLEEYLGVGAE